MSDDNDQEKNRYTLLFSKEMRPMLAASSIGMVFVVSIVIGAFMGVWIDGKLSTKPWFTLFFLGIGIASGIKNAYYFIKKSGALEKAETEKE
ncbi:MAG: AtpZ/AtpI family protein [Deferribacteraceae bacterium]|jgi:F0F1-type ATP synthase assembly protein I|nr:AtpZ/AtpI family protein [Deferribacteraceae bacterium]